MIFNPCADGDEERGRNFLDSVTSRRAVADEIIARLGELVLSSTTRSRKMGPRIPNEIVISDFDGRVGIHFASVIPPKCVMT